ncbi:MAG: GerAB/ArcD/ProY family transporter, partial [Firmicutes bacterium]|nr:GerAB/ArcD/ProY family transporter [Bacillota bacterium]
AARYARWGLVFVVILLLIIYETVLATFGPSYTMLLRWPTISFFRILTLHGFFIDKLGSLMIILWAGMLAQFNAIHLSAAASGLAHLRSASPANAQAIPTRYPWLLSGLAAVSLLFAWLLPNIKSVNNIENFIVLPITVINAFIVPVVILLLVRLLPQRFRQATSHLR